MKFIKINQSILVKEINLSFDLHYLDSCIKKINFTIVIYKTIVQ